MRIITILVLLALSLAPTWAAELESPGLRLLKGSLVRGKTVDLDFLGDEDNLGSAALPVEGAGNRSISAKDIMADLGPELRKQAAVYGHAQLAAGKRSSQLLPLHVILDPEGTWAYAHNIARFRYRYFGRSVGPLTCPALVMGMKTTYARPQSSKNEGTAARNQQMLDLLGPWYAKTIESKNTGNKALERELKRWTLTMDDGSKRNALEAVSHASCKSYRGWLKQILVSALNKRKLDGDALWESSPHKAAIDALVLENQIIGVRERLAETVSHEMGHLIHFTAAGPSNVNLGGYSPHMKGTSHKLTTLSNEEFAFVEGWAEANAYVVLKNPEALQGKANRIDYKDTEEVLRTKLNEAFARATSAAVHQQGYLAPSRPFQTLPFDSPREEFMAQLRKGALGLNMPEAKFDRLISDSSADDELAYLLRAESYVSSLQAKKGQLKTRYDYLRSERSVAHVLAHLRLRLGDAVNLKVLKVLAKEQSRGGKPDTLAEVLESFVSEFPEHRQAIYELLAEITEGILVTDEEAALVADAARTGLDLEIDLDRDGWVPGGPQANANLLHPLSFPEEPSPLEGEEDPLSFAGKRNETLVPMLASIPLEERSLGETPASDQADGPSAAYARSVTGQILAPSREKPKATLEPSENVQEDEPHESAPLWDDLNLY